MGTASCSRRLVPLGLILLLLSGCSRYVWVKPFGDPSTYPADTYACQQESFAAAPPAHQIVREYVSAPVYPACAQDRHHIRPCPFPVYAPVRVDSHTVDLNEGARNDLYNACMQARGWQLQLQEDRE